MDNVQFLNIAYIIARIYQWVSGTHVDISQLVPQVQRLIEDVAIFGICISIILLALIVYVRIRTEQIEEVIEEAQEHRMHSYHSHTAHEEHVEEGPKNPRWEGIVLLANSPNESDWRRAILDADIMLSALLTERGYTGETIADQLKDANPLQFTTKDLAWEAHRMRNALAHLGEAFPLTERDARATIDLYRRVFEEFDYI